MKTNELMVLGLAGVAVYMIWKAKSGGAAGGTSASPSGKPADWVSEIFGADGKRYDNGWRYFSDGTTIDPQGNYYKDGALIWQKPGAARYI
jgi:hypothetical protein